jgi:peroxiredoxin
VDALAQQVLAVNPTHPVHHYLIHLWNNAEGDKRAIPSAARCGQSAPAIAHMWHMSGHTFSNLRRYNDGAWQQEASARVDHAYMAAARIMPEQIHNYAHNNDWLVENLGFIGRVHDAVDLAKNMIELPRLAPGATRIGRTGYTEERNGFAMGRRRLLATLLDWGHWDELLALDGTMYLPKEDEPLGEATRLRVLGVAAFQKGDTSRGQGALKEIESQIAKAKQERIRKAEEAETQAKKDRKSEDEVVKATAESLKAGSKQIEQIEKLANELRAYAALASGSRDEARTRIEKAGEISKVRLSQFQLALGDGAKAMETARAAQKQAEDQVLPLANLAEILWKNGKKQEAIDAFHKLRPLCPNADTGEPALARLRPIADELHLPADWRPKPAQAADTGKRPDLASLGPFRWHPYEAPAWTLEDDNGATRSLAEFKGRPVLVVFYLGSGCSHCIEQLNTFSPMTKDFRDAGISIVAVSTEPPDELHKTFAKAIDDAGFPFPILADPKLAAFKAYRAFDDFENMPLHGTFLIDGAGLVRWQDISYRPFTQAKWLLGEAKRLLALPQTATAKALSSSGARVPGPQRSALSAESDSRSKN